MDSNREKIRSCLVINIRKLVKEELKETIKDTKFKKFLFEMLDKIENQPKNSSNERQENDLPIKHKGCRATQDLVEKLQKEVNVLKKSVADCEKENQEYRDLVYTYMTTCLGCIEDFDFMLTDLRSKINFEKKFLHLLKILQKNKIKRRQSYGNKAHKSSHAKDEDVEQAHGDDNHENMPTKSKKKAYQELLEAYTLGKDDTNKQHTTRSRPRRGNAKYTCPTGTAYDILGTKVNSHTKHHNHQETPSTDNLHIRERTQQMTNLILLKKSKHSLILNRFGPQLPFSTRARPRKLILNELKEKCAEFSDKNANNVGDNLKAKNLK